MEQTITRVIDKGMLFAQHRSDKAFCAPSRESIFTGMSTVNHGVGSNEPEDYYPFAREGRKQSRLVVGGTSFACGPWERDLAKRAGLADTPVDPLTGQGATGGYASGVALRASQVLRADLNDDLQAYTGSLPCWLEEQGITVALFAKYTNALAAQWTSGAGGPLVGTGVGYPQGATRASVLADSAWLASRLAAQGVDPVVALAERYVPPGWTYWRCLIGQDASNFSGGSQNHWKFGYARFAGDNPGEGDGKECTDIVYVEYQNSVTITRSGSTATVAFTAHGMQPGDEFAIDSTNDAAWEGTVLIVATVPNVNSFTYTLATLPAATTAGGSPKCYPRRNYGEGRWQEEAAAFITSRGDNEPWLVYYAPDNPHFGQQAPGGTTAPGVEREQRYIGTVNENDAWCFDGVPGWIPDKSAECTGTLGGTRISQSGRRADGSGPFNADDIGEPVLDLPRGITSAVWTSDVVTLTLDATHAYIVGDTIHVLTHMHAINGAVVLTGVTGTTVTYTKAGAGTHSSLTCQGSTGRLLGTVGSVDTSLPGTTGGYFDLAGGTIRQAPFGSVGMVTIGAQVTSVNDVTSGRRQYWQRRQEMMASVDDTIGVFLDECEARGWTNVTVILTGDNGQQTGEWQYDDPSGDLWVNSKVTAYEGSLRSFLAIRHPPWWGETRTVVNFPTAHYDLCPTIVDFFAEYPPLAGLANHHVHTKRDGVSIARLFADPALAASRAVLIHDGQYHNQSGEGIVVERVTGFPTGVAKLIRNVDGVTEVQLFDVQNDGVTYRDYERTDLAGTYPSVVTTLAGRLNALRVGRWDPQHSGGPAQTFRSA
jgi:hypothetical protein